MSGMKAGEFWARRDTLETEAATLLAKRRLTGRLTTGTQLLRASSRVLQDQGRSRLATMDYKLEALLELRPNKRSVAQ